MSRLLILSALVAATLRASATSPAIATPAIGMARMQDGSIRAVAGAPGSFVLSAPSLSGAVAASFSKSTGIVGCSRRVLLLDENLKLLGSQPTGGPALVNVSAGPETAIAWVKESSSLLFWTGKAFVSVTAQNLPAGAVWSLVSDGHEAVLSIDDQQATVSLDTGALIDCHPLLDSLRDRLAKLLGQSASDLTIEQMSNRYVHVSSRNDTRTWVIDGQDYTRVWELPAVEHAK